MSLISAGSGLLFWNINCFSMCRTKARPIVNVTKPLGEVGL